jgi:predicted ATP-binding protein involved in virulence
VSLFCDLARRAAILNPHLGGNASEETAGVVLIDELDLLLHPKWQRSIIENLRRAFPKIQFICTTHSPFLIQSLRSGEELIMLDGQPTAQLANKSIEEIAQGIMGVSHPQVSQRYEEMKGVAKHYLETLEEAAISPEEKLEAFKQRLADAIAPYADNPAFQAILEMERVAKLGE